MGASMELIYTTQTSGFDDGKRYRNPTYFDRPEPGVTKVTIVGDWPEVAKAYGAVEGVDVAKEKDAKVSAGRAGRGGKASGGTGSGGGSQNNEKPVDELTLEEAQERLKAAGIDYPADADEAALRELLKANQQA